MKLIGYVVLATAAGAFAVLSPMSFSSAKARNVLYGFTAFPYDLSAKAEEKTHEIILPNSNLYAVHMDQCLPWRESLNGSAFPQWLQRQLMDIRSRVQASHTVYVAMTPTAQDRHSLAPPCSATEGRKGSMPRELRGAAFDHPLVKKAYMNYMRRVIEASRPAYVNIGIEVSELSLSYPQKWPAFESLYLYAKAELKRSFPNLKVGIELGLQSIMLPRVGRQVKSAIEASDYIGISFYPYATEYGKILGAPDLPSGVDQWRKPLEWLRGYTDKPIAICETGYTTRNIRLSTAGGINFRGDQSSQKAFLEDLIRYAVRDDYLFVVWFVPVDYAKLLEKLGSAAEEWMNIWVYAGLFTPRLEPKPAWKIWKKWKNQKAVRAELAVLGSALSQSTPTPAGAATGKGTLGAITFTATDDLFRCSRNSRRSLTSDAPARGGKSMQWRIDYAGEWEICEKDISVPSGANGLRLLIKSDKEDYVLVRATEKSGEVFYALVPAGKEWSKSAVNFADFKLDDSNRRDGRFQPSSIISLVLGEGGGAEGAKGSRTIWLSAIEFF